MKLLGEQIVKLLDNAVFAGYSKEGNYYLEHKNVCFRMTVKVEPVLDREMVCVPLVSLDQKKPSPQVTKTGSPTSNKKKIHSES